ncbi:MAG: hypothetical protein RIE08_15870 [Acidimicrobiales bacterium]
MRRSIAATLIAAALIFAVAACGSDSPEEVPTGLDLVGTWSQTGAGYENGVAVTWENQTVVIVEAEGQGFTGFKEYTREGEPPTTEAVNGVVGVDGEVLIVDDDGWFEGRFVDGTLQGQYAESGGDASAINVVLARE